MFSDIRETRLLLHSLPCLVQQSKCVLSSCPRRVSVQRELTECILVESSFFTLCWPFVAVCYSWCEAKLTDKQCTRFSCTWSRLFISIQTFLVLGKRPSAHKTKPHLVTVTSERGREKNWLAKKPSVFFNCF